MNYLLTATVLLFALWPAYYLLLRYSEKYSLNRLLLLLAMVAVCALPFLEMESPAPVVTQSVQGTISYVERSALSALPISVEPNLTEYLATDDSFGREEVQVMTQNVFDPIPGPYLFYGGVCLLAFFLLGLRLVFILRLHLRSRPNGDRSYRLLHPSAKPGQAFTFGHLLYFSIDVPDDGDFEHILAHERVHARQLHTFDILVSEVFLCLFWFHPAAWWLRTKMRANLEYLVDQEVVKRGSDRRSYQLALVRQSQAAQGLALALPFSEPSLKSRIVRLSGMPEYRLVGVAAALGLLLWMGVAMVTLNGTMGEPVNGNSGEYLAASAMPGDPYFNYYQHSLPDEVTSMEFYLNRMVTVDEYLQLRAIVSQVPGAKIYVYSQPYDLGYNLEIRYGLNQPATLRHLKVESAKRHVNMLGLEQQGTPKVFLPIAMDLNRNLPEYRGETGGMITYWSGTQTESDVDFFQMTPAALGDGLRVYVNRKQVALVNSDLTSDDIKVEYNPSFTLNGVQIAHLSANDWPKVVVEGRTINSPRQRMSELLGFQGGLLPDVVDYRIHKLEAGTFRSWFETQGLHKYRSLSKRYNDRFAKLDMLLDTEFGPGAMMQLGYRKDRPGGMLVVQVLDDYPNADEAFAHTLIVDAAKAMYESTTSNGDEEIEVLLRRFPTPGEVAGINEILAPYPEYHLTVFKDCRYPGGALNISFDGTRQEKLGFSNLLAGDTYEKPLRSRFTIREDGSTGSTIFRPGPAPEGAPLSDISVKLNDLWISISEDQGEAYNSTNLDQPPAFVRLLCKLNDYEVGEESLFFYLFENNGTSIDLDKILQAAVEEGYTDRSIEFYIGDRYVELDEFQHYEAAKGSSILMGTISTRNDAPLIIQITE